MLARRGFRMQPWAVEWDEAAVDFLIEQGFSAELGARPLKRAVEQHLLTRIATAIVERQFPEGDQFLFITARDGTGLDVAFVDPDAEDAAAGRRAAPARRLTLARVALDPEGSRGRGRLPPGELTAVAERVRAWDAAKAGRARARRATRLLGVGRPARRARPDRVPRPARRGDGDGGAARRTPRPRSGKRTRASSCSCSPSASTCSRPRSRGLDAREASDATVTVRSGHGGRRRRMRAAFVQELAAMYVGWADGSGMRSAGNGANGDAVLEVAGLGAYTLLQSRERAARARAPARRTTASSTASPRSSTSTPAGQRARTGRAADDREPAIVRRYRHEPVAARPRRLRHAHRPDRPRAGGDFDLLGDARPTSG